MDDFFTKEITPFARVINETEPSIENVQRNENPNLNWEERWKFTDKGPDGKFL